MFDFATFVTVREEEKKNFRPSEIETMGARNSSPRTVQFDNDAPSSVIDVSEAVVDRLKGLHTKGIL